MKALIQRVKYASVTLEDGSRREIGPGLLVLFCAVKGDAPELLDKLARKTAGLRIFSDREGKMNLSALDLGLEALVISQFTLAADTKKGMRPSFIASEQPEIAKSLYKAFAAKLREAGISRVQTGEFGQDMKVELLNDGPVTIILDTKEW